MKDVSVRIVVAFTALLFLVVWLLVWVQWPAYQVQLAGRAVWILLIMAAWWLAGRVLAGK